MSEHNAVVAVYHSLGRQECTHKTLICASRSTRLYKNWYLESGPEGCDCGICGNVPGGQFMTTKDPKKTLTTTAGIPVGDNQNSLTAGAGARFSCRIST